MEPVGRRALLLTQDVQVVSQLADRFSVGENSDSGIFDVPSASVALNNPIEDSTSSQYKSNECRRDESAFQPTPSYRLGICVRWPCHVVSTMFIFRRPLML